MLDTYWKTAIYCMSEQKIVCKLKNNGRIHTSMFIFIFFLYVPYFRVIYFQKLKVKY